MPYQVNAVSASGTSGDSPIFNAGTPHDAVRMYVESVPDGTALSVRSVVEYLPGPTVLRRFNVDARNEAGTAGDSPCFLAADADEAKALYIAQAGTAFPVITVQELGDDDPRRPVNM